MKIFKIISWWWKKQDHDSKCISMIFIFLIAYIIFMLVVGPIVALMFLITSTILSAISYVFIALILYIRKQCVLYEEEKDLEAKHIIDRLRGIR